MTHKHHLLPKHIIRWDDPFNIEECTVEEHAEYHRYLWEAFGYYEDYIAWKTLSGQISKEEAQRAIVSMAQTGRKHTKEHIEKRTSKYKGRPLSEAHKNKIGEANKGWKPSVETRLLWSKQRRNRVLSEDTKKKISASMKRHFSK